MGDLILIFATKEFLIIRSFFQADEKAVFEYYNTISKKELIECAEEYQSLGYENDYSAVLDDAKMYRDEVLDMNHLHALADSMIECKKIIPVKSYGEAIRHAIENSDNSEAENFVYELQ